MCISEVDLAKIQSHDNIAAWCCHRDGATEPCHKVSPTRFTPAVPVPRKSSKGNNYYANHQRSRSFDASAIGKKSPGVKSNLLSGLLNRIKAGTSGILSASSNESSSECSTGSTVHAPPSTPISTVVVVDPSGSGPAVTTLSPTPVTSPQQAVTPPVTSPPVSSPQQEPVEGRGGNEKEKEGIPWDNKTGYFLDPSLLGMAIENHLKRGDNKGRRRATFCTIADTNNLLQPGATRLDPQQNRPRSASACPVLPVSHHSMAWGHADSETLARRRESIASVFPSVVSILNKGTTSSSLLIQQPRRNSSFNPSSVGGDETSWNQPEEVIVGSFIKTSMTSELYSEGEVIMEEEQNEDAESYDKRMSQKYSSENNQDKSSSTTTSSFLNFWNRKPTETIIDLFSSASTTNNNNYTCGTRTGRFSFVFPSAGRQGSVTTINEEEEEATQAEQGHQQNTICGYLRRVVMQIINSLFRS